MVRFSENFVWCAKNSKLLGQGISNVLFQIILNSVLEFVDSVYASLVLDDNMFETVLYETRIKIIRSFKKINTQTTIVGNIHGVFSWLL